MLWSSAEWCDYFRSNAGSLLDIPWSQGVELSEEERAAIAESVQDFQLGESSEGRHLLSQARQYAQITGDVDYVDAISFFIREEQRHARDLGRFLTLAGIPLISHTWPDTVFRWLRRGVGLELSIRVLITPEIIALVYFAALGAATRSVVLQKLCEQIVQDEVAHVRFQCERLAILRKDGPIWKLWWMHGWQRLLLTGACFVVWWKHGRTLKAGKFGFGRFWRAAWSEMKQALRMMDPRTYADQSFSDSEQLVDRPEETAIA